MRKTEKLYINVPCTYDPECFYPVALTFSVNPCCVDAPVWVMAERNAPGTYYVQCSCGERRKGPYPTISKAIRAWEKYTQTSISKDLTFYTQDQPRRRVWGVPEAGTAE